MCTASVSVCPANDAGAVWTVKRVCVVTHVLLTSHTRGKKKERKRAQQMEVQRDKDKMGRWGSDGKESKEPLSHVQERCEDNAV